MFRERHLGGHHLRVAAHLEAGDVAAPAREVAVHAADELSGTTTSTAITGSSSTGAGLLERVLASPSTPRS